MVGSFSLVARAAVEHKYHRSPNGQTLLTKLGRGMKVWTAVSHFGVDIDHRSLIVLTAGWCVQEDH